MDRGAPSTLLSNTDGDHQDQVRLIADWHGRDQRLFVALTPRFALSCSDELLAMLGRLRRQHPTVYVQTHYAESQEEIATMRRLYPKDRDYLAVYERFDLVGPRTLLGHAIHVSDDEWNRLKANGTSVSHCPTSNLFLGSGLFPLEQATNRSLPVGIGTDVGAGTSFSIWRTLGEAYKVQRLRNQNVTAAELFYLATLGGARAIDQQERVGNFEVGKEADFQVLDLRKSRLLSTRRQEPADQLLAAIMTLGDDRLTKSVYIRGKRCYSAT
jgi:guanine deaminase